MSNELSKIDYELHGQDELMLLQEVCDFADYFFGEPKNGERTFDKIEKLRNDGRYFFVSRAAILNTFGDIIESISLKIFTPTEEGFKIVSDEAGTTEQIQGDILWLTADTGFQTVAATHCIGRIALDAIGDIELVIDTITDREPVDPAQSGAKASFTDHMLVISTLTIQK